MAINQINTYTDIYSDVVNLGETTDTQRTGYHRITLTEMGSTVKPEIAAGSKFENNGALWEVTTDTAILGSPSDGTVGIYFDPSVPSFNFSNSYGVWSDTKQGFYSGNNRYLEFEMEKVSTSYHGKTYVYGKPSQYSQTGGMRYYDFLLGQKKKWDIDLTNRTAGSSLAVLGATATSIGDYVLGRNYEIVIVGEFTLEGSAPTNPGIGNIAIQQTSGTATFEMSVLNANTLIAGTPGVPVTTITGPTASTTFDLSVKAIAKCTLSGTSIFSMYWSYSGLTNNFSSDHREIYIRDFADIV